VFVWMVEGEVAGIRDSQSAGRDSKPRSARPPGCGDPATGRPGIGTEGLGDPLGGVPIRDPLDGKESAAFEFRRGARVSND
jgi:hypothetical protein